MAVEHTYSQSTLPSSLTPETLATYRWLPPSPKAAVFLLHGFRSHARFNFLRNDTPESLHHYGAGERPDDTSLIRELNTRDVAVFAHDHVGHGRSSGLRAYFPSFGTLVADAVAHVRAVDDEMTFSQRGLPIFLVGHSLGGTVAIITARDNPGLFAGVALSSAATQPPASMLGIAGRIQRILSGITSALIPTAQLLALPKSTDAEMQALYDADPLNRHEGIRARVGRQFLNAYQNVSDHLADFTVPFLAASGELDTLVDPAAAKRFYEGASSTDKTLHQAKGRWHNLFVEKGREELWTLFADWISARCK